MKLKFADAVLAVLMLFVAVALVPSAGAQTVIRAEHDEPVESITHRLLLQAAGEIDVATKGQIKLEVHPSSSLSGGKIPTMIQNVQAGNVDLSFVSTGIYAAIDPRTSVVSLPFMFGNIDDFARLVRQSTVLDKIMLEQQSKNIVVVDLWARALRQIANNKREIRTPDDLKGLRIRVPEFKLWIDTFKAIGAVPVPMPFSEIPTALQLGTIDGAERPSEFLLTEKWWELAKFVTMTNYSGDALMVMFNKGFWEKLTPANQKLLSAKLKEVGDKKLAEEKRVEQNVIDTLRKNGVKVTILTPAETEKFRVATRPVWADYESRIGKELIEASQKAAAGK
jgi:tripartite ATP-independent transporter DctP family solute receptor